MEINTPILSIQKLDFLKKTGVAAASFTIVPRFVLGGSGYIPPSDKITLGFLGTGKQAPGLGGQFLKLSDIQMVAACDVDTVKLGTSVLGTILPKLIDILNNLEAFLVVPIRDNH